MGRAYLRRRYAILFYSLLLTMVIAPAIGALEIEAGLLELFLAGNLLIAVVPVGTRPTRRVLFAVLIILGAARVVTTWLNHPALSVIVLAMWTIIGLFAAAVAVKFAFSARSVDREHVYAALSAYLLAGIFLGVLCWVLEQFWPGSYTFAGDFSRVSAIYFSFVTLATLGYGDIVPRTDVARGLAIVEGVGGQLFLAVLVARLVSLYARGKETNE